MVTKDIKEDCVEYLNEIGCIGSLVCVRKFRVTHQRAVELLNEIADEYENVHVLRPGLIYIKGRLPEGLKKPPWKDVKKP